MFLILIGLAACIWISYEDFRTRYIPLWGLIILAIAGLAKLLLEHGILFYDWLLNLGICLLIWGVVYAYFKWLRGQEVMDQLLGWGDVVMLLAITPWLQSSSYLLLYIVSVFAALIFSVILRLKNGTFGEIPLAGFLGLSFIWIQGQSLWLQLNI